MWSEIGIGCKEPTLWHIVSSPTALFIYQHPKKHLHSSVISRAKAKASRSNPMLSSIFSISLLRAPPVIQNFILNSQSPAKILNTHTSPIFAYISLNKLSWSSPGTEDRFMSTAILTSLFLKLSVPLPIFHQETLTRYIQAFIIHLFGAPSCWKKPTIPKYKPGNPTISIIFFGQG